MSEHVLLKLRYRNCAVGELFCHFPSSSARFVFFDYCYFKWDTRRDPSEIVPKRETPETPAGYPNKNSNNRKIESARRTMGRQTQTCPDSELLSCESFI